MNEAIFISGNFLDCDLPKEQKYLYKYFKTETEKQFLSYYYLFKSIEYFTEHTGIRCQQKWLKILAKRQEFLMNLYAEAKKNMDLEMLACIEAGKYKLGPH